MLQRTLFFLLLISISGLVRAQTPPDFYAASVPVADRSAENYRKALRETLVKVLSKASGSPQDFIRSRPDLAQDLAQGDKLASQFVYFQQPQILADGTEMSQLRLKASFPEQRIMALLQKGGLTFWAPERPRVKFWLLAQTGTDISWSDSNPVQKKQLQISLSQPMLNWGFAIDSQTPEELSPTRVWQMDSSYLEAILHKLEGQPLLLAKIDSLNAQQVVGTIGLLGRSGSKLVQAQSLDAWIEQALAWASQQLATHYAVQLVSNDNELILTVAGIEDYADYEQLMAFVEGIDVVRRAQLVAAYAEQLRLVISYKTEVEQLQQRLLIGGKLLAGEAADSSAYHLHMQWNN